jgi:hypothetical protein
MPILWQLVYVAVMGSTTTPASSPDTNADFNPDPGAMLKPVPSPLFTPVPGEPSAYGSEPLPAASQKYRHAGQSPGPL